MTVEMSYDLGKHSQGSLEDHSALHISVESGGKILVEGEMHAGTKGTAFEAPWEDTERGLSAPLR